MKSRFRKLRQTSFDELRVRGAQKLAAFLERHRLSSKAKLPSDEQLLLLLVSLDPPLGSAGDYLTLFQQRQSPTFFAGFTDPTVTVAELRRRWPESEVDIINRAEKILNGKFDLLGFNDLYFGDPIDWQLEPISGKRSDLIHWSTLNYLDADRFGDKKIVWELNRHQY